MSGRGGGRKGGFCSEAGRRHGSLTIHELGWGDGEAEGAHLYHERFDLWEHGEEEEELGGGAMTVGGGGIAGDGGDRGGVGVGGEGGRGWALARPSMGGDIWA